MAADISDWWLMRQSRKVNTTFTDISFLLIPIIWTRNLLWKWYFLSITEGSVHLMQIVSPPGHSGLLYGRYGQRIGMIQGSNWVMDLLQTLCTLPIPSRLFRI